MVGDSRNRSGRGQTDKVLREVAAYMEDESGSISRPEQSAFSLLQVPGSKRLGAKDWVKSHPGLVDLLVVMYKVLGVIMDLSSILSLCSVAFMPTGEVPHSGQLGCA